MHGVIVSFKAKLGQRDALIAMMIDGINAFPPACISFVVAKDAADENMIWVTEIWDSKESHEAALRLPAATALLDRANSLTDMSVEVTHQYIVPMGGIGLDQ